MPRKYPPGKQSKFSRALTDRTDWRTPFLEELARTSNLSDACRAAKIDRQTYYNWMKRQDPKGKAFQVGVQTALEQARDVLRREIHRRAVEGVPRPQFTKSGDPIMVHGKPEEQYVEQQYSDTLLIKLATAHLPEFKEKQTIEHTTPDGKPIEHNVIHTFDHDRFAELYRSRTRRTGDGVGSAPTDRN